MIKRYIDRIEGNGTDDYFEGGFYWLLSDEEKNDYDKLKRREEYHTRDIEAAVVILSAALVLLVSILISLVLFPS